VISWIPPGGSLGSIAVVLVELREPLPVGLSVPDDRDPVMVLEAAALSELDSPLVVVAAEDDLSVAEDDLSVAVADPLSVEDGCCVDDCTSFCLRIKPPSLFPSRPCSGHAVDTVVKRTRNVKRVLRRPLALMLKERAPR
jgi:hypothetical protein